MIDPSTFAAGGVVGRRVEHEVVVAASPRDAWEAWVDPARVTNFLGEQARIDLRIGGRYEIIFLPDAPEGEQGSETCRILAYLPGEMLAFSWNAPPQAGRDPVPPHLGGGHLPGPAGRAHPDPAGADRLRGGPGLG